MRFKANVTASGNRHQRHLQIAPAPGDRTVICVFLCRASMSNDCGWGPMSLILSAVLTITYLLKFAAMRYLAWSRRFVAYRGDNIAASIDSE